MKKCIQNYDAIMTFENIFLAWKEFVRDKSKKPDVIFFQSKLMDNLFALHEDLSNNTYRHGRYTAFKINDPKPRDIHKATVRDRVVHHLLYNALYDFFDKTFVYDSYSCRKNKGTHKALQRFRFFILKESKNMTKPCYVLKCDVRKFFASIDHAILKDILKSKIQDENVQILLEDIVDSFHTNFMLSRKLGMTGLPLGNLTSQLLVNIYMNEFDQFVKRDLKIKYYIRYADDFVILSQDKVYLENIIPKIADFLEKRLCLKLHPDKVFIKSIYSGVDFLGWIEFGNHRVLRASTKKRMFRILEGNDYKEESVVSYRGMLKHGNGRKIQQKLNFRKNCSCE